MPPMMPGAPIGPMMQGNYNNNPAPNRMMPQAAPMAPVMRTPVVAQPRPMPAVNPPMQRAARALYNNTFG